MVHRESVFPNDLEGIGYLHDPVELVGKLADAKELLSERGDHPRFLLSVKLGEGVQAIWCYPSDEEEIRKRLKTWSGCYGAWPLRRLNGEALVPTVR